MDYDQNTEFNETNVD